MTSSEKAEKLIQAHDGDMALLYIYFSKRSTTSIDDAVRDLYMTRQRAEAAYEKLETQGFFNSSRSDDSHGSSRVGNEKASDDDFVEYTSAEIESASHESAFKALLSEAEKILGKILTKDDMSRLLDIYKHLGMPAETIYFMMHYCEIISSRKPRMSYIQKTAYTWHGNGIIEIEKAEEYVERQLSRNSELGRIKSALCIRDRELTTREREMANSWIDMGFTEEDVHEAYEICVDRNGKYVSAYINKILLNWKENGKDSKKAGSGKAKTETSSGSLPEPPKTIRKGKK